MIFRKSIEKESDKATNVDCIKSKRDFKELISQGVSMSVFLDLPIGYFNILVS